MKHNGKNDNRAKTHVTRSDEAGQIYCRAMHFAREAKWYFCRDCVLFGGFIDDDDESKGVNCVYAEAPFLDEKLGEKSAVGNAGEDAGGASFDTQREAASSGDKVDADSDRQNPSLTAKERYDAVEALIREGETGDFPVFPCRDDICQKAIRFAAKAHKGAFRKGNSLPYIIHPIEVMSLVSRMTDDAGVIAAGALHDVVEDTPYTVEDIRERFGERIAAFVDMESENKRPDRPKSETWRIRKEESLSHDKDTPIEAKYIMLADKLSNMRATQRDFKKDGHKVWQKFNMKDEAQQEWYYRKVAEVLGDLCDEPLYKEYVAILDEIFGDEGE